MPVLAPVTRMRRFGISWDRARVDWIAIVMRRQILGETRIIMVVLRVDIIIMGSSRFVLLL